MPRFVQATNGPWDSVIYVDDAGNRFIARGGDRNYRNNNPGNLVPGEVSKRNGQIGSAGGFAVFPDVESGRKAMRDSLRTVHGNRALREMIEKYAPDEENDTPAYLAYLRTKTGVRDDRRIKDFSTAEFDALCAAIEKMEGKRPAVWSRIKKKKKEITRVRKNKKGVITHYEVEDLGWLNKAEALAFTRAGEIDAVIAMRNGKPYLRTRPDVTVVNNLENKE